MPKVLSLGFVCIFSRIPPLHPSSTHFLGDIFLICPKNHGSVPHRIVKTVFKRIKKMKSRIQYGTLILNGSCYRNRDKRAKTIDTIRIVYSLRDGLTGLV